jgi:hypothetical protein
LASPGIAYDGTFFSDFAYENDANIDNYRLFPQLENCTVKEVEVFKLAEETIIINHSRLNHVRSEIEAISAF